MLRSIGEGATYSVAIYAFVVLTVAISLGIRALSGRLLQHWRVVAAAFDGLLQFALMLIAMGAFAVSFVAYAPSRAEQINSTAFFLTVLIATLLLLGGWHARNWEIEHWKPGSSDVLFRKFKSLSFSPFLPSSEVPDALFNIAIFIVILVAIINVMSY